MDKIKIHKVLLILVLIFLFVVPFFWMKPNQMDLGGDSGRLYFYDPVSYLKNASIYGVVSEGTGIVAPYYFYLPLLVFITFLKFIFQSPYILISLFTSAKLVIGFLSVYFISKEFINFEKIKQKFPEVSDFSSIIAGVFYVLSLKMTGNYDNALMSHNQIFLNPLIFYLIMKYIFTEKRLYIFCFFIISFIFAPAFSLTSAPPMFAFYPLSIIFLFLYIIFIKRKKIKWKNIFIILVVFIGLQSFHMIPQITSIFDPGSFTNTRIFDKASIAHTGIDYFLSVLPFSKASENFLLPPLTKTLYFLSFIFPLIIILGFFFSKQKNRSLLMTAIFFLITYFFLTGKLSDLGINFYLRLFYIPGFTMFRNFIGQWSFVFSFFYALLIGQSLIIISENMKQKYFKFIIFFVLFLLVIGSWSFLDGEIVNGIRHDSKGVRINAEIDPNYEKMLKKIRNTQDDSKILTLPFTDFYYQVIFGKNEGAYVGISTIAFLGGKKDFSGYQVMPFPFNDNFLTLAKEKKYNDIKRLLGILNIKYIYYNSDSRIYDSTFYGWPYQTVRQNLPNSQKDYSTFVYNLVDKNQFKIGTFNLFSIDKSYYLPHFYTPAHVVLYGNNQKGTFLNNSQDINVSYMENTVCKNKLINNLCKNTVFNNQPKIYFQRINPTKYKVEVFNAKSPYLLVFSESFHKNWKVYVSKKQAKKGDILQSYFNGNIQEGKHSNIFLDNSTFETFEMKSLPENHHTLVNGYANAWYITPSDINGSSYELIIELNNQKTFYYSLALSVLTLIAVIIWGISVYSKKNRKEFLL